MTMVTFKLEDRKPMTAEQRRRIESIRDEDIDYSDIPPLTEEQLKRFVRGRFYRPTKQAISVRIDSDIISWLKSQGKGYQTRINAILRDAMLKSLHEPV